MTGITGLLTDEQGFMSVDFVLWLPLFLGMLLIVTDASILYLTQTQMWNIARDTARRMTTQQIRSIPEARCYTETKLSGFSDLIFTVELESTSQFNSVQISVLLDDAAVFGYLLDPVLGTTIDAQVTMRADPTKTEALPETGVCLTGGGNNGGNNGGGNNGGGDNGGGNHGGGPGKGPKN
jgi:uncharacterized membrane protein YgcG